MTIVVTTPTGHVGSNVVRLLLQAGVRPRLLLRDPGRLDPVVRERVDAVRGDQGDPDAVLAATRGAHALFWVDPPTMSDDPVGTSARMGANAARAVRENGIGHTVFLSSVGAEARGGFGLIDGLARTEEQLDATGAAVLHLRCGYFATNLLGDLEDLRSGVLRTAMPLDTAMPWVDPRDIGDVAAANLLAANWSGRRVQGVHGPEDLTPVDVAATITRVTGHRVEAEPLGIEEMRAGLRAAGLGERQVEGIVGMSSGFRGGFVPEVPRSALTTTPTPLDAWVQQHLAPLLA